MLRSINFIHQHTLEGAALTIFREGDRPLVLVISSEIEISQTALTYCVVGETITGNVHRLEFDKLHSPNERGVEFFRDGLFVAYLTPVTEEGDEAVAQWQSWKRWLSENPGAVEAIAAEIQNVADDEGN